MSVRDLRPLARIIGNARVVGLGESVHGVQEFFEIRHRLLRFLVEELGFTAFAMETGFAEAARINDYVLGRIDEPARWQHDWFTWGFGDEEELQSLVRWMRSYNADPNHRRKLRFYGVDVAVTYSSPLVAVRGAVDYVAQVDSQATASSLRLAVDSLVRQFEGSGGSDEARGQVYGAPPRNAERVYRVARRPHQPFRNPESRIHPRVFGGAVRVGVPPRHRRAADGCRFPCDRSIGSCRGL